HARRAADEGEPARCADRAVSSRISSGGLSGPQSWPRGVAAGTGRKCLRPWRGARFERARSPDRPRAQEARQQHHRDAPRLRLHGAGGARMSWGSLRLRLVAGGIAAILLALTIAGAGLTLLFERHLTRTLADD